MVKLLLAVLLWLSLGAAALAAPPDEAAEEQLIAAIKPRSGRVALPGGIATLDLPADFRYLSPADTDRVLQAWGNPPDAQTLGMIVPAGVSPLAHERWGVVVTYDKDGHAKLLKTMQDNLAESNPERKKQGYPAMTLVGWAETPHYDKASHKLYWAKELQSGDSAQHGLNYNIRVLGREGVLVLNAVAGLDQLGQIKTEMQKVTTATNFTTGNQYGDFNGSTDKVAEYGIAALVAGGVAAKLGLFAKLFGLLLAFKKIVVIGVAAAGSWLYKFFKRKPAPGKVDLEKRDPEKVE
jgi:uncharacterized membrane-anchored protein